MGGNVCAGTCAIEVGVGAAGANAYISGWGGGWDTFEAGSIGCGARFGMRECLRASKGDLCELQ